MTKEEILAARATFKITEACNVVALQQTCQHNDVLHWNGEYSSGTLAFPVRLCKDCGLEEQGGWWCYSGKHWHALNGEKTVLGNNTSRVVKVVSFDDLKKARL